MLLIATLSPGLQKEAIHLLLNQPMMQVLFFQNMVNFCMNILLFLHLQLRNLVAHLVWRP